MASLPEFLAGALSEAPRRALSALPGLFRRIRLAVYAVALAALALALLAALAAGPYAAPPKYSPSNYGWDGVSSFYALASARAQAKTAFTSLEVLAGFGKGAALVVIAPEREYSAAERERIREFVSRGGTLVISDARGPGARLAREFSISFGNATLVDYLLYNRRQDFPAIPFAVGNESGLFLAKFPVALLNYPQNALVLASTSPESYLDFNGDLVIDGSDLKGPFPAAVAAPYGEGAVVAISDADVFTNDMLFRADNVAFADAVLAGYANGTAIFDDTHRAGERAPALAVLSALGEKAGDAGFIAAAALAAAFALFAAYMARSRLEKKEAAARLDPNSHNFRDLVSDIRANAKTRAEPYTWIALMHYDRLRRSLAKGVGAQGKEVSDGELSEKAAEKFGWDREGLESLLARLEALKSGDMPVRSLEESAALCRMMDGYLESMKESVRGTGKGG
ncbi:MAG: DUF4350 domain-containing protein [Candidatus ainarchaeum sp.]|nr:DUF4350 domain-containing protein [Candidatus ainarchaeum sp.]